MKELALKNNFDDQKKSRSYSETLRGQTVHWIGAQFCVCMFLDSRDKSKNMFQNVSEFHKQKFSGYRVHILVT